MSTERKRLTGPVHGRIRQLRKARGLKLIDFAAKVGCHVSLASHWEQGWSRPAPKSLAKIAKVLRVTELELVRGEDAYKPYERLLKRAA